MNFEEFKELVAEKIKDYLPKEYKDSEVKIGEVIKNNNTVLSALTITSLESNVSPTIYLNDFYKEFQNGKSMDDVMRSIANIRISHEVGKDFDVSAIMDFNYAKEKIVPRLVGTEENQKLLKDRPYKLQADLAVTYCIALGESEDGSMTIPITNALMNNYGINIDELHEIAMGNLSDMMPGQLKSMNEVMIEMMMPQILQECDGDRETAEHLLQEMLPPDNSMYALTNNQKLNGATSILDEKLMDKVAETIGGDFYILPSSTHEVIIVPMTVGMEIKELEDMVKEVNRTQVMPQERLSDHVYTYDVGLHQIHRADRDMERTVATEKSVERNDTSREKSRSSVKEKLAEKQKKVATERHNSLEPVRAKVKSETLE